MFPSGDVTDLKINGRGHQFRLTELYFMPLRDIKCFKFETLILLHSSAEEVSSFWEQFEELQTLIFENEKSTVWGLLDAIKLIPSKAF